MNQEVSSKTSSERKVAMILLFFVGVIVFIGAVAVAFESGNLMVSEEIGRGKAIFYVTQEYIDSDVPDPRNSAFLRIPGSVHPWWLVDVIWDNWVLSGHVLPD